VVARSRGLRTKRRLGRALGGWLLGKADTSCSGLPRKFQASGGNKYTSANITWLSGIEPRDSGSLVMKKRSILVAGCGLFASLVFVGEAQAQSAQEFVNKVAISDMFEIQSSRLALAKQPDKDTKPFAEKMIRDHQKTSNELKSLVNSGKVKAKLPTALDSEHQKMLDELKAKSGKEFDSNYDQIQVKAHEDAVALFDAYAKGGDDPDLKRWAAKTLPHLKQHLTMAEKLK
jgi:putative membrane protein